MKKQIIISIGVLFAIIIILGFAIKTSYEIPPNAIVYLNVSSNVYYGAPTVDFYTDISNNNKSFEPGSENALHAGMWKMVILPNLVKTTYSSVSNKGYKPDEWSEQHGEFKSEEHCLWVHMLENIGIIKSSNRWNEDGTWKY